MGCVSSNFLAEEEPEDDESSYSQISGPSIGHIVSLTSTTYGLLTLDSPQTRSTADKPSKRFGLSLVPTPLTLTPLALRSKPTTEPEVINSWELMEGLDNDSFRVSSSSLVKSPRSSLLHTVAELDSRISRPLKPLNTNNNSTSLLKPKSVVSGKENEVPHQQQQQQQKEKLIKFSLDGFVKKCPPGGENKVVIYTTSLRGIRKTFEDCNRVRSAFEGVGVWVSERDVSMHLGFREELRELMGEERVSVPRVFVKGRYVGGAEEVLQINEEGGLVELVEGLPRVKVGVICDGCGGVRFVPCFVCNGSCKLVEDGKKVVRCPECNENGLVICPICR